MSRLIGLASAVEARFPVRRASSAVIAALNRGDSFANWLGAAAARRQAKMWSSCPSLLPTSPLTSSPPLLSSLLSLPSSHCTLSLAHYRHHPTLYYSGQHGMSHHNTCQPPSPGQYVGITTICPTKHGPFLAVCHALLLKINGIVWQSETRGGMYLISCAAMLVVDKAFLAPASTAARTLRLSILSLSHVALYPGA